MTIHKNNPAKGTSMLEIEAKIIGIDKKKIEERLRKLGAHKVFDGIIDANIYDFPNKSIQSRKELLRLRLEGKKAVLTYKARAKGTSDKQAKQRNEYEVEVSDFRTMQKILEHIGVQSEGKSHHYVKHRTSYHLGKTHIEIDTLTLPVQVPTYLEIEAPSIKEIQRVAHLLGYGPEDCKAWTMRDVLVHYHKKF